jgi:transcriptional regulator CtsR
MKKSLADGIEKYLKVLLARSENRQIEIQRAELAETFSCAPSQVTYVLGTRFTEKYGYSTESRRGGQGYIRITQLEYDSEAMNDILPLFKFIEELKTARLLNEHETEMLKYIVNNVCTNLPREYRIRVKDNLALALRQFLEF